MCRRCQTGTSIVASTDWSLRQLHHLRASACWSSRCSCRSPWNPYYHIVTMMCKRQYSSRLLLTCTSASGVPGFLCIATISFQVMPVFMPYILCFSFFLLNCTIYSSYSLTNADGGSFVFVHVIGELLLQTVSERGTHVARSLLPH